MRLGVRYTPEFDRDDRAAEDAKLMKRAGLNAACVGPAMWDLIEPSQGRYAFQQLDRVVSALADQGIAVFLCIPVNTPPLWAFTKYDELARVDERGESAGHGGPLCFNAPSLLTLSQELTRALAHRYGDDAHVAGWRMEIADATACFCEHCAQGFRDQLVETYENEEALSESWGVRYRAWTEIGLPRGGAHPSHALAFARFTTRARIRFYEDLSLTLRNVKGDQALVCDAVAGMKPEDLSFAAESESRPVRWIDASYRAETARTMSERFAITEALGDAKVPTPTAGAIRRWIWQGVANGADRAFCGHWRSPRSGKAMGVRSLITIDDKPGAAYKEVRKAADELKKIVPQLKGALVEPKIALLVEHNANLAATTPSALPDAGAETVCRDWYAAVKQIGHGCDVVTPDRDLSRYKMVLAPWLPFVNDALADQLEQYVKEGGRIVFGPGSGARTPQNTLRDVPAPGLLLPIAGVTVEETVVTEPDQPMLVNFPRGALIAQRVEVRGRVEILDRMTAQAVCEYVDGRFAGKAAITRYTVEKGEIHYIGAHLPPETLFAFLKEIAPEYPMKNIPEGVEVTQRRSKKHRIVFILNHTAERKTVTLPKPCLDLLADKKVGPEVTLSANGVLILRS